MLLEYPPTYLGLTLRLPREPLRFHCRLLLGRHAFPKFLQLLVDLLFGWRSFELLRWRLLLLLLQLLACGGRANDGTGSGTAVVNAGTISIVDGRLGRRQYAI